MSQTNIKKVCVEALERELAKGPITSSRRGWSVLSQFMVCFVAVARQVDNLTIEVYGNGTPGGLKQGVSNLSAQFDVFQNNLDILTKHLFENERNRRKGDFPKMKDKDSFAQFTQWFIDKILPSLIITTVIGLGNLLLFISAFIIAITNGWIILP